MNKITEVSYNIEDDNACHSIEDTNSYIRQTCIQVEDCEDDAEIVDPDPSLASPMIQVTPLDESQRSEASKKQTEEFFSEVMFGHNPSYFEQTDQNSSQKQADGIQMSKTGE